MNKSWINCILLIILLLSGCSSSVNQDGGQIEQQVLSSYHLAKDFNSVELMKMAIAETNCITMKYIGKKMVFADSFHSADSNEILVIPFVSNGKSFRSSAYSDVQNRFILVNPSYIREFTLQNTLTDSTSFKPVLQLMLLHEIGHFKLRKTGAFDTPNEMGNNKLGEQRSESDPEYITSSKKLELNADSIAIVLVKEAINSRNNNCLSIGFDVERIIPGMQFQLSSKRTISDWGKQNTGFLHDPSSDHPNMELRITFMNYFLTRNDAIKTMIDDYIYNRTVAPVHRQEFDPAIFQGKGKKPQL